MFLVDHGVAQQIPLVCKKQSQKPYGHSAGKKVVLSWATARQAMMMEVIM